MQQDCVPFLIESDLMPLLQSAYWPGRSTETTLVKVISDIIDAADEKNVTLFGLLDMCGAFDTVDFQILLHRPQVSYGHSYSPLLAVPNVTSHPSTASVSTSYYSTCYCNCFCTIKG